MTIKQHQNEEQNNIQSTCMLIKKSTPTKFVLSFQKKKKKKEKK